MFGLVRKKEVVKQLEYIEDNIREWEDIWGNSQDENVRDTVTHTLNTINKLVKHTKDYFSSI